MCRKPPLVSKPPTSEAEIEPQETVAIQLTTDHKTTLGTKASDQREDGQRSEERIRWRALALVLCFDF